jgi:hypothetical protein
VRLLQALLITSAVVGLAGCAQWQSAAWDTTRHFVRTDTATAIDQAVLRPELRYLRVTTNGSPALLVLGDIDQDAAGRPVEVWYSASREVLRLQGGRLVGVAGMPVEWRDVRLPASLPSWKDIQTPVAFTRERDEMPGYRIGVREQMTVRPIAPPSGTGLQGTEAATLQWYEETTSAAPDLPASLAKAWHPLPPTRFAVRKATATRPYEPVYGEQCLVDNICLQWQTWPPRPSEN